VSGLHFLGLRRKTLLSFGMLAFTIEYFFGCHAGLDPASSDVALK
jgi:hypothetical protein